jgi:hypothetical protein
MIVCPYDDSPLLETIISATVLADTLPPEEQADTKPRNLPDVYVELNLTTLTLYLSGKTTRYIGFHIDPENSTDQLPAILRTLWQFGIHTVSDLDRIMTDEYFATLIKYQIYPTYYMLLENAMMYHDLDHYFEKAWQNRWQMSDFGTIDILNEKYGEVNVKEVFNKYEVISEYDAL